MPISQPTFKPNISINATDIKITNLAVGTTETSHALSNTIKKLVIRSRENAELYIAFVSGDTTVSYLTLKKGCVLCLDGLEFTSKTLYIRADQNNTVEIVETFV